ncbi:hypothetical protein MMC30_000689 [Trapelia coarctata]|nr:hypothetical protein [Trapelia coarctata]
MNLLKVTTALIEALDREENGEGNREDNKEDNGEVNGYFRRKSERALHDSWGRISSCELKPLSPWLPFLPRWVEDDQVLRQILGFGRKSTETTMQRVRRMQREEEKNPRPLTPLSPSSSIFTDYGPDFPDPDCPVSPLPEALHVEQERDRGGQDYKPGNTPSRNNSSSPTDIQQVRETSETDHVCSNDRPLESRLAYNYCTSEESSLIYQPADSSIPELINKTASETSSPCTRPSFPESTDLIRTARTQSPATGWFQSKEHEFDFPDHDSSHLLSQDVVLQPGEATGLELSCSSKDITPILSSLENQQLHRVGWQFDESPSQTTAGGGFSKGLLQIRLFNQADATTATLQKRKRDPQDLCSVSNSIGPPTSILRPRKRPRYKDEIRME